MSPTDYLKQRRQTWYVRLQIPEKLRAAAGGKFEFVQTLRTRDLQEANRRKHAYIAEFQRQLKALEEARGDPLRQARLKALEWRDAIEKAKGETIQFADGTEEDVSGRLLSDALDEVKEAAVVIGDEAAVQLARMLKAATPPLAEQVERWLDQQAGDITGQTISQHRMAVREFLSWAGQEVCIGDVSRKLAGEYTDSLLAAESGLSRRTAQRRISSLSAFWMWLEGRGLAENDSNPWLRQLKGKRPKRGQETPRSQWADEQIVTLLTGKMTPRYTLTLHDLVRLALVTGARLDELCSLKTTDTEERKDGWWIKIRTGKTEAAVREVPVHEDAAHLLKRRRASPDGFVFPGLVPGGPDKKRSWSVSKAFGRYCDKLGLTDQALTFHSLRKTFTEAVEGAEVPEPTTKLLIGHARQSLTYGHYSRGQRVDLRKAIRKLKFSRAVMVAIRRAETEAGPPEPREGVGSAGRSRSRRV
jgi:integrase